MPTTPTWPVSSRTAPTDNLYGSATWLLGRHARLAELAARVGVVTRHKDGPDVMLDELARSIAAFDQNPGVAADPIADAFARLASGERAQLRLLATFSATRAGWRVADVRTLDEDGRAVLTDWLTAVAAY